MIFAVSALWAPTTSLAQAQLFSDKFAILGQVLGIRSYSRIELLAKARHALEQASPETVPVEKRIQLIHHLVETPRCLGIDPLVFISMIWRESEFRTDARSERGARGLSQMTTPALKEIQERLHADSARRQPALFQLVKQCSKRVIASLPENLNSPESIKSWRVKASKDSEFSLALGAILLKLYVAQHGVVPKKYEDYAGALERYNGDPAVKKKFAQDIIGRSKELDQAETSFLPKFGIFSRVPTILGLVL